MPSPPDWLSWTAAEIAEYGRDVAARAGLNESEARSLVRFMYMDAGLRPDGSTRKSVTEADRRLAAKWWKQHRRRDLKRFAKDPVTHLATQARHIVENIRHAVGCLQYSRDDGSRAWLVPRDLGDGLFELTDRIIQVAASMRAAAQAGNVADQVRHAHSLGVLTGEAQFRAYQQPKLDRLKMVRERQRSAGGHNRKGPSMDQRREAYFARLDEGLSPMYAAEFAAEDLNAKHGTKLTYENMRAAFPQKRLPKTRPA